jgi:hypothetical protein
MIPTTASCVSKIAPTEISCAFLAYLHHLDPLLIWSEVTDALPYGNDRFWRERTHKCLSGTTAFAKGFGRLRTKASNAGTRGPHALVYG